MTQFCRACGSQLRLGALFCSQCRTPTNAQSTAKVRKVGRGPKLWLISTLVAVSLAIGVGYFAMRNDFSAGGSDFAFKNVLVIAGENRSSDYLGQILSLAQPKDILFSANNLCDDSINKLHLDSCRVFIIADDRDEIYNAAKRLPLTSAANISEKLFYNGDIIALYVRRSNGNQTDELLAIDCGRMQLPSPATSIICLGEINENLGNFSGRSPGNGTGGVSNEMSTGGSPPREGKLPDAEVSAAEVAAQAYADAAAAATDAAASPQAATGGSFQTYYIIADANQRDRPSTSGALIGKISRGMTVQGRLQKGEDGVSNWLQLKDNSGFVSAVNISQLAPPRLATIFGERRFYPPSYLQLHASPSAQSPVIDTVPPGTLLIITGVTANGFAEAKGRRGGAGYFMAAGYDFSK